MKACMGSAFALLLVAALAPPAAGLDSAAEVTPVQKVIQLLNGMMQKGKDEKHAEQVQFAAYKQFCEDTVSDKTRAVEEANGQIDTLKADIQEYAANAARLTKEIAAHEEDIAVWKGDKKAATKVRELEKADYDAMHQDYAESVDALQRAIAVLKKQAHNRPQASLTQVTELRSLSLIPPEAKRAIDAFIAEDPAEENLAVSAPEAHGYESRVHGVIEMLEKLLDKFIAERTTLEKEEMSTKQAFEVLMQDLAAQIESATQDVSEKSSSKAKKLQARADAEGDLTDTTTTRDDDQKYLSDLTATCEEKATDFESRQRLRAEELQAIQKAIEIISGAAVSGNAEKHLPSSLLQAKAPALAQMRAEVLNSDQAHAAQFLRERAKRFNSRVLAAAATRVGADPFQKVKKMIKELIVRLMEEANEEAEHKGWCDTELATNEQTRKEKTQAVEMLHAEIDELEASVAKLTEDITELTKAVAALDAAMAEATKLRQEEKEKNAKTIADATEAQTAVVQALTVLKEFYAKAGESTALLQQQPEAPEIFDAPYKGMQAENGGVIGMLEVIQSDFARLQADTEQAEATAQKEYEEFMTDSKVDKAAKSKDIEHKTAKKQDQSQALTVKKADLEGTQKELDAALAYFDKLKPSCVDSGVSYEDRVTRRHEEIESLQQALRILNGEDIAL